MLSYQRVCAYHEGFCMQNCYDSQICLHVLYILSYCRLVSCSVHGSVLCYYSMLCCIVLLFCLYCVVMCIVMSCDFWTCMICHEMVVWTCVPGMFAFFSFRLLSWDNHSPTRMVSGQLQKRYCRTYWGGVLTGWQTQKAMATKYFGSKFIISITPRFSLLKFCKWRSTKRFIIYTCIYI